MKISFKDSIEDKIDQVYATIFPELSVLDIKYIKYIDMGYISYCDLARVNNVSISAVGKHLGDIYKKLDLLSSSLPKQKMKDLIKIISHRKELLLCVASIELLSLTGIH